MLEESTPLVLCVECPVCEAKPGKLCREFNTVLIAHPARQEATQGLFERAAQQMREHLSARLSS